METTVILSIVLAVSAILGTCGLVIAAERKFSGLISAMSARLDLVEKRMEGFAADLRSINEHLRQRG